MQMGYAMIWTSLSSFGMARTARRSADRRWITASPTAPISARRAAGTSPTATRVGTITVIIMRMWMDLVPGWTMISSGGWTGSSPCWPLAEFLLSSNGAWRQAHRRKVRVPLRAWWLDWHRRRARYIAGSRRGQSRHTRRRLRTLMTKRDHMQVRAYLDAYRHMRQASLGAQSSGGWRTRILERRRVTAVAVCVIAALLVPTHLMACRVGEARNPGPADKPHDATPNADGDEPSLIRKATTREHGGENYLKAIRRKARAGNPTRHTRCTKHNASGDHHGRADDPTREEFALTVETFNGTAWGSCQLYLQNTRAHVVLLQEHHLAAKDVAEASRWLHARGWKSVFVPAAPGQGDGIVGGTAVLVRS